MFVYNHQFFSRIIAFLKEFDVEIILLEVKSLNRLAFLLTSFYSKFTK